MNEFGCIVGRMGRREGFGGRRTGRGGERGTEKERRKGGEEGARKRRKERSSGLRLINN